MQRLIIILFSILGLIEGSWVRNWAIDGPQAHYDMNGITFRSDSKAMTFSKFKLEEMEQNLTNIGFSTQQINFAIIKTALASFDEAEYNTIKLYFEPTHLSGTSVYGLIGLHIIFNVEKNQLFYWIIQGEVAISCDQRHHYKKERDAFLGFGTEVIGRWSEDKPIDCSTKLIVPLKQEIETLLVSRWHKFAKTNRFGLPAAILDKKEL